MANEPKVSVRATLGPIAARLNRSTDLLNESIQKIEDDLRDLNIGLNTWVPVPGTRDFLSDDHEEYYEAELGFDEHESKWRLLLRRVHFNDEEIDQLKVQFDCAKPLVKCTRKMRIDAVAAIPHLLESLAIKARDIIEIVEKAQSFAGTLDERK